MENLINSMIVDCNEAVKAITQGQYILFCRLMYEMVQKLVTLKQNLEAEKKSPEEGADAQ